MLGRVLGHYRIEAELGAGGMGDVYRARDEHLQRDVAIKVLSSGTLADATARSRFRAEALSLSRLSHPHIATVYDFDTQDDCDFLVLEYLPGQPLSRTLTAGPLPEAEVVRLGCQVAEGLVAAHAAGIIHRDLKPANLMLQPDGRLKILDFGLAKLRPAASDSGIETTTATAVVAGTLPYMAPEQLRSERVDGRTDVYALGVLLYEMATAQVPHCGTTSVRLADAILHAECLPPSRLRPGLSPRLDGLILKCLAKDPAQRYQSASDLLADLHRVLGPSGAGRFAEALRGARAALATGLVVVIVGIGVFALNVGRWHDRASPRGADGAGMPSIAVLPLKNLSGDPEQDYFSAGITEDIISHLTKVPGLKVISRTSVEQYKNTTKSLKTIGHELGVKTIVEGSVRRAANRVRVAVQLIDAATDAHLWAETYDRELSDVFKVQSDVARQVASALHASLSPETAASLEHKPTGNLEAYDYFLRASDYYNPSGVERPTRLAIQLYEQAVKLDPTFALAYARLAEANARMWWYHWDRDRGRLSQAKAALERAAQLQPDLPDVHRARGFYYYWGLMDFDQALKEFEIARKGRPGDSWNVAGTGWIKRRQGRFQESLADQLLGMELDPRSANIAFNVGETLALLRRPREADPYYDRALELDPGYARAYVYKARVHLRLTGDAESARAVLQRADTAGFAEDPLVAHHWVLTNLAVRDYRAAASRLDRAPGDAFSEQFWFIPKPMIEAQIRTLLEDSQTATRRYETARAMLERLARDDPQDSRYHSALGLVLAGLGLKADAIRAGKHAVELLPVAREAYRGMYRVEDLARIYAAVGEFDAAIDQLEYLASIPSDLGAGALRLDPAWDPLRSHSRFKKLLERSSGS